MQFKIVKNQIVRLDKELLTTENVNSVECSFSFSKEYDGLELFAVFYRSAQLNCFVELTDGKCFVPWEMLETEGVLYIGAYGVKNTSDKVEKRATSNAVTVNVVKSLTSSSAANAQTPDILRLSANVRSFGAKGNGVTDDTAAVRTALAKGIKALYFPAGNYLLKEIVIDSGVTLWGDGENSVLIQSENATGHFIRSKDFDTYANGVATGSMDGTVNTVRIEKLKLSGNRVANHNGIAIYGYNIVLDSLNVCNFGGYGIHLESPGSVHSTETRNLQNDLNNLAVSYCSGGNIYYNGQSDSVMNNILCYYGGGESNAYEGVTNFKLGTKAPGCKLDGVHLWGNCATHLVINAGGSTFTNLHVEGAHTQVEVNSYYTTMSAVEIYNPIHKDSTGFQFGSGGSYFNFQGTLRQVQTAFDYQGDTIIGKHIIVANLDQNGVEGAVAFTSYPQTSFLMCSRRKADGTSEQIWHVPALSEGTGAAGRGITNITIEEV